MCVYIYIYIYITEQREKQTWTKAVWVDAYKAHQLSPSHWKQFSNVLEPFTKMEHELINKSMAPQISKSD